MAATTALRLLLGLAILLSAEGATFTEWLRDEAGERWERVVAHRFTDELATGTISNATLTRYLVQDHRFLDNFSVLLASMVAKAPSLADRVPGAQFLALILGKENTYFERSLRALGVSEEAEARVPEEPVTKRFKKLMLDAARSGDVVRMLVVLVVAEWSYLSWGERVVPLRAEGLPFYCGEWIDLHSGDYFRSVIAYLRELLDRLGSQLSYRQKKAARALFLAAVECENDFFDMAYEGDDVGPKTEL